MRRLVLLAAALLLLGVVTGAGAVPIRDVAASVEGNRVYVSATVYSPPSALSCGARYLVVIFRETRGLPRYALRGGSAQRLQG